MEIDISRKYNIRRLQHWLDYELSTSLLFFLNWFWNIAIVLMTIAAVLFTPFMLKVLIEERRIGWIIFFVIIVVIPVFILFILNMELTNKLFFGLIPLALFYFYCFLLRIVIRDW